MELVGTLGTRNKAMDKKEKKQSSKHFTPSNLSKRLIPMILGLLLAGLLGTINIITLSAQSYASNIRI